MAINRNSYLQEVLDSHKMSHVENQLEKFKTKRSQVKEAIELKYSGKLASSPINSGSFAKHTAINKKYDIDLCIPFKRSSFDTLEAMSDELIRFFENEYKDGQLVLPIRRQKVSVGLKFLIDGTEIEMDIVPGRELNDGEYPKTNDLKLFIRTDKANLPAEIKTNIQKHIELISGKNAERSIIRLLKIWKYYTQTEIKSFLLELITIRAFDDAGSNVPDGLWAKLEMTLIFIRDKIETVQLVDPANSNNIVSYLIDPETKMKIANKAKAMLEWIEKDPESIKSYFKINPEFPTSNSSSAYIIKGTGPSVLSTQSFG